MMITDEFRAFELLLVGSWVYSIAITFIELMKIHFSTDHVNFFLLRKEIVSKSNDGDDSTFSIIVMIDNQ